MTVTVDVLFACLRSSVVPDDAGMVEFISKTANRRMDPTTTVVRVFMCRVSLMKPERGI